MSQGDSVNPRPQRINIELGDTEAEGIYANLTMINQSGSEFVIDFARIMPGRAKAKVYARIVMAPPNVKAFLSGLQQNLNRFEELHGPIGEAGVKGNIGFQKSETEN